MAKISLTDLTGGYQSATVTNANNDTLETFADTCLSRDGTAPNAMGADIDMNSNKVTNLADGTNNQDAVTVAQLNNATLGTVTIVASMINAELSTDGYVLTSDGAGNAAWEAPTGIASLAADTTPQLGGNLDVNGNKIVSVSNGDIDIEPNGTGNVHLGNFTFNADQTVGAGQDNYVLTYDNGTGLINLEAAATTSLSDLGISSTAAELNFLDASLKEVTNGQMLTGSGTSFQWRAITEADISDLGTYITDVVNDTTPQLGGNLASNGSDINIAAGDNISWSDGTDTIVASSVAASNTLTWQPTGGFNLVDFNVAVRANSLDVQGNITVSGTVDGRDVASDGALAASAMQDLVDDTTPQLGGNLDTNSNNISGAGTIDMAPNARSITTSTNTATTDYSKVIRMTAGSGQTLTLDSDPPTNACILLDNSSGNNWTIAASTSLIWAKDATTGNRTLAGNGLAVALHRGGGTWIINGSDRLT